jgi:2-hydroxychromene-2-carboxylate isomerase
LPLRSPAWFSFSFVHHSFALASPSSWKRTARWEAVVPAIGFAIAHSPLRAGSVKSR